MIFTRRGFPINEYSAIRNHLEKFRKQLEPRPSNWNQKENGKWPGRKPGSYNWYDFQDNIAYYEIFEKEKLMWLAISDKPAFAFDQSNNYVTAPAYILRNERYNKYLMVVLNSKVMEWYLDKISSSTGVGTNQWSKIFVEQLPIPQLSEDSMNSFNIIADYLVFLNDSKNEQISFNESNSELSILFDQIANMMVFELYFSEQMKKENVDILSRINLREISELNKHDKAQVILTTFTELMLKKNEIIFVGSSMGAWISLNLFRFFKNQIKGFLGIGSAPEFLEGLMWNKFSKVMKKEIKKNGIIHLKHGEYEYPITLQLIKDGRKNRVFNKKIYQNVKVTMVHGDKDLSVPVNYSRKVLKIFKNAKKKLVIIKNGNHSLSSAKQLNLLKKQLKLIIN